MPADPVVKPLSRLSLRQPGFWMFPAVLTFFAGVTELVGEPARLALRYEREAIGDGQLYRLLSGHLVHLGPQHLLLNLIGLILVWILVGGCLSASHWFLALGVIVAGIDLGFWVFRPTLDWYVGLSGVLHGLLVDRAGRRLAAGPVRIGVSRTADRSQTGLGAAWRGPPWLGSSRGRARRGGRPSLRRPRRCRRRRTGGNNDSAAQPDIMRGFAESAAVTGAGESG